jgi:hypothetical protein
MLAEAGLVVYTSIWNVSLGIERWIEACGVCSINCFSWYAITVTGRDTGCVVGDLI